MTQFESTREIGKYFSDVNVIVINVDYLDLFSSLMPRGNKLYVPSLVTHVQLSGKVGMR